jgi:hypothetical protein
MDLLFQGMIFALHFEVDVGHFPTAFDHLTAQSLPAASVQPFAQQFCDYRTALAGRHLLLKLLQRCGG